MIIPRVDPFRTDKVIEIRDACKSTMAERRELYAKRRKYYLFGSDDYRQVRYNRLFSHLDLVTAFLYSADHAKYTLAPPRNSDKDVQLQAVAIQDEWNQQFRDCGMAYQYRVALTWALVNDSSFMKVGWSKERNRLTSTLIQPNGFGVYDEQIAELDDQEAFLHVYRVPYDNAILRLLRAGLKDFIPKVGVQESTSVEEMPPVLKQLLITATGGQNLTGNMMGQAPLDIQPVILYESKSHIPTVEWQELWVWDDIHEDYATFIIAEPDILVTDTRETISKRQKNGHGEKVPNVSESNEYLPGEHPFVPIIPYTLPDYAFGECHSERLIPLQDWTSERLDQIAEKLDQDVDPSKTFSGFMGLSDEKASALGGPGTWVLDALPGAKTDFHRPSLAEDAFAEFKEIGAIFLEASGLTEILMGQGDKAGRGRGQAKQMQTTGGGRIKQAAIGLEPSLVQLGDLGVKLLMKNSDEKLLLPDGSEFLPSLFAAEHWNLRVAGHSHSPLFVDDARELAALMLKAQAIDREMFVRLLSPPQEDTIISALRERVKIEAQMRAQQPPAPRGGGKSRGEKHG